MIQKIQARLRRLFVRHKPRSIARRGPKPAIGASIVCDDLRMMVRAGTSDELWLWLLDRGWREQKHRPDRRQYRDVPVSLVNALIDAAPHEREKALLAAVNMATKRTRAKY